jgi:hypothetical protein
VTNRSLTLSVFEQNEENNQEGGPQRFRHLKILIKGKGAGEVSPPPLLTVADSCLKVHKHEIFLCTFFAETESLWSQGPVTRDF